MAFVRTKTRNGKRRYHLVENYREDGKVRQRTIAYLGEYPTIEAAIEGLTQEIQRRHQRAESSRREADAVRQRMHPNWIARNGGEVPKPRREGARFSRKLFGRYWSALEYATSNDYWADKRQHQLDKLHAYIRSDHKLGPELQSVTRVTNCGHHTASHVRSDHKSRYVPTFVGTTPGAAA